VAPHDAPAEVEAEAHAGQALPSAAPAELLEYPGHVLRVDALAVVGDFYPDPPLLADHPQLDGRALGRVFGGVREQVAQDLPDPLGVGEHIPSPGKVPLPNQPHGMVDGKASSVGLGVRQQLLQA
jgi:hypothetical protein